MWLPALDFATLGQTSWHAQACARVPGVTTSNALINEESDLEVERPSAIGSQNRLNKFDFADSRSFC